jgi:CubicO group peptidase (beta-lactamase class C family)
VLLTCHTASSQALSEAQVDSVAKKVLQVFKVPGLAVGIVKDGKLIYSKGFGVRSLTTGQKVDSQTLFGVASNTKAFTAAALGILVDEGKIKWDDKVIKYLPGFKLYDAYATKDITIRDLLVHHSGLATGAGDLMHDPDSTTFSLGEIIYNLRYIKPAYSFRSRFAYDNNLYLVAGAVIAKVAKMSWEDFVTSRLLRPLQMNSSSASFNGISDKSNIIDAHNQVGGTVKVVTRYASTIDDAAGGIYANVPDMCKWLLMLLNNGKYGEHLDKQLLSPGTVRELLAPQTLIPTGAAIFITPILPHTAWAGLWWMLWDTNKLYIRAKMWAWYRKWPCCPSWGWA